MFPSDKPLRWSIIFWDEKNLSNILKSWTPTSGMILHKVTLIFMWSPSVVTIMAHYVVKERPTFSNYFQLKTDCVVASRLFNNLWQSRLQRLEFSNYAIIILSQFLYHLAFFVEITDKSVVLIYSWRVLPLSSQYNKHNFLMIIFSTLPMAFI